MSKYNQLSQLKALFDGGALTQEEFDAAKKRILESDETPHQQKQEQQALFSEDNTTLPKKSTKWIILSIVTAIIIIVAIVYLKRGNDIFYADDIPTEIEATGEEDELAVPEEAISGWQEESFEEQFERRNPWHKEYFKDEWGEPNTSKPYIYTTLQGTSWNIHIDYSLDSSDGPYELFRLYLVDEEGHITSSYGPVNILIRGSDGVTQEVEVTGTRGSVTFIEAPSTVMTLKHYLDQEEFDILMEFEKYNERHTTKATWYCDPGFFQHAIDTML